MPDTPPCRDGTAAAASPRDDVNPGRLPKAGFRIRRLLSRGLSASASARAHDVSLTTMRTPLRSICRKAEAAGYGEPTRRLMSRPDRISETLSARLPA